MKQLVLNPTNAPVDVFWTRHNKDICRKKDIWLIQIETVVSRNLKVATAVRKKRVLESHKEDAYARGTQRVQDVPHILLIGSGRGDGLGHFGLPSSLELMISMC